MIKAGQSITLDPTPGFVVKTRILEATNPSLISTKVFINVCHDPQVPRPPQDFDPAVVFPLIIENQWEVPLIVSRERETTDKKGVRSLVYDCCMNNICFQWTQLNKDLRSIVIEWSIEAIEMMYSLTLERDISLPKMVSKGELERTEIPAEELDESGLQKKLQQLKQDEVMGLVEEMGQDESDEELPEIMNISGKANKPIIEELGELNIGKKQEKKKEAIVNEEVKTKSPMQLSFQLSFEGENATVVKIVFPQINSTECLNVSYNVSTLEIHLDDPNYYFSRNSPTTLEVPLPPLKNGDIKNVAAEFLREEHALYLLVERG